MLLCVSVSEPSSDWPALLDALDAVSPLVEDTRPGLAFLEMRGIDGTPAAWMAQVRALAQSLGIAVRVGSGATKIAARGAAHVADGTAWLAGSERAQLAALPLTLLDIEPEIVERLRLLGIDRLGALARLPHGPFVRRFGREAARWHAEACGRDVAPFMPRGHAIALGASLFGEGRVEDEAQVFFALRLLLSRICGDLDRSGKRTGLLALDIELEDGATSDSESRVSLWGVVPARGVHRNQSWGFKSGGGAVLQQARSAEQWIKEGKQAVKMTRLSCHRFRANEVRLWLSLIAYNLGNLWRRLALPMRVATWSLTSLQQRLVKTGGRLIKHARYYWLLLAESHLTRRLFAGMLAKIAMLPSPAG